MQRIAHQRAVVYDSRSHWLNSRPGEKIRPAPPEDEFTPFDAGTHTRSCQRRLSFIWSISASNSPPGKPALGFVFVRQVLVAGPVDIRGLPLDRL